jgi:hypothetical protein
VDDGTGSGTTVRACVKAGKKGGNTLVDDGTGSGTTARACVKAGKKGGNTLVDDGTGSGTMVRACVKGGKMGFNTQENCMHHRPATRRGELEGVTSAIRVRSRSCMPSSARSASAGWGCVLGISFPLNPPAFPALSRCDEHGAVLFVALSFL